MGFNLNQNEKNRKETANLTTPNGVMNTAEIN